MLKETFDALGKEAKRPYEDEAKKNKEEGTAETSNVTYSDRFVPRHRSFVESR